MLLLLVVVFFFGDQGMSISEGDAEAEFCVELIRVPNDNFPIETNLYINVSTQDSKAINCMWVCNLASSLIVDTAMAGSDYLSLNNAQIIFPAGSVEDAIECINVTIIDDDEFEEQEEQFMLLWTPEDTSFSINPSGDSSTIIMIVDNDSKSLFFAKKLSNNCISTRCHHVCAK